MRTLRLPGRTVAVVVAVVALVAGGGVAYAAVTVCPTQSNPSHVQLEQYMKCRLDAIEVKVDALAKPPVTTTVTTTVTAAPTTVTVTATPSTTTDTATTTATTSTTTAPAATFPDATNTGWKNAPGATGTLKSSSGLTVQSDSTYVGYDFGPRDFGTSSAPLSNVKFVGCRFKGSGEKLIGLFGSNFTFEWSSFEPAVTVPPVSYAQGYQYGLSADGAYNTHAEGLTLDHVDMWGFGNGVTLSRSTQAQPVVVKNSWIHDARNDGGIDHTDGIGELQGSAMSFVTLDHNTIESKGNTNGIAFQYGPYSDFTVTNNLIGGWGYSVAIGAQGPGPIQRITFTGNTFSTRIPAVFGPVYPANFWTGNGNLWRGNKWSSTDANNGKFWTPDGPAAVDYTG